MRKAAHILSALIISMLVLGACRSVDDELQPTLTEISTKSPPIPTQTVSSPIVAQSLATPISQVPASGICGQAKGDIVVITINPDVPDPRCIIIAPNQFLKVVNNRDEIIQVSLGVFETLIRPGEDSVAEFPFGNYLAPGVHVIEVSPCCGASLWLKEEGSLSPDAELALQTLNDFFTYLQAGRYAEASLLYGGSYNVMRDHNPELDPDDYAALFHNACTINGAMCLKIRSAELWIKPSATEFRFMVEFENPDSSLFVLGPCCGDTNPSQPQQKEFIYTVKRDDSGSYMVMEMPVYLP